MRRYVREGRDGLVDKAEVFERLIGNHLELGQILRQEL